MDSNTGLFSQIRKSGKETQRRKARATATAARRVDRRRGRVGAPHELSSLGTFGDGCYLLLLSLFSLTKSSEPSVSSSSSPDEMASVFKRTHPWLCFCQAKGHRLPLSSRTGKPTPSSPREESEPGCRYDGFNGLHLVSTMTVGLYYDSQCFLLSHYLKTECTEFRF